jgi:hypothetical protein
MSVGDESGGKLGTGVGRGQAHPVAATANDFSFGSRDAVWRRETAKKRSEVRQHALSHRHS